jgi:hypothetical protein
MIGFDHHIELLNNFTDVVFNQFEVLNKGLLWAQ